MRLLNILVIGALIVAASYVHKADAGAAAPQGGNHARGHISDINEVQATIHYRRKPATAKSDSHASWWRLIVVARADR